MTAVLDAPAQMPQFDESTAEQAKARAVCPECSAPYVAKSWQQLFCCPAHKRAYNNRWLTRGAVLAPIAAAARATRDGTRGDKVTGVKATRDANRLYQKWKEEDERAGRLPVEAYMALRYRYDLVEVV